MIGLGVPGGNREGMMWRVVLVLAIVMSTSVRAAEPAASIRVVFNTAPNPPITYGDGTFIDPDKPSLIVEMLRMVGERTGIVFEFQRVPWQRGLYMIEHGQADAIFASSFTPDRLRYGAYPMKDGEVDARRMIYLLNYTLFVRRGAGVKWNGSQISGLQRPVGVTQDFAIARDLKAMGVPLEPEANTVSNLRKLALGRIDAYAEIESLAEAAIKASPAEFGDIVRLQPPLRSRPYYLMFSKRFAASHPDVAERVWNAIPEVTTSAEYRALATGKYAQ
ncbi:ABC-type amino acid transport/signal transduction systems, periplasmic component/domain [Paramagnetospirillum magneticum AMB-1]|uniref:ABC-type amino acid transport/signal transduction systems, periplasmic component/domain n=2 Tax=Paramagnetospirillum magneticum TaxID=84159 RepID=Q2W696_PARM1|nr:ABC-type amino acid transport/signal transduction systems, periplasmic component/domain [Paramagnetospirillum magneticum AMB-1]